MRNVAQVLKAPLQQQEPAAVEVPWQREQEVVEVPSQQQEPAELEVLIRRLCELVKQAQQAIKVLSA